jgi:hypothetical protein
MSFTVKRRQTKKPLLKTPNKRLFRNFNIKGLKTRPILLTDAKGQKNKRPTRFIEPSMGPRSDIRLVFDGQAVQDAQDGAKALPELYRKLMEEKAAAEGIPLKDKLDRERAREEVKQQNRDEIEQYKLSKHYLDNIAEIQRRDLAEQQAQEEPILERNDEHEQKDGGSDDDSDIDSTLLAPTIVGEQAQQQILSNDPLNQFLEEGGVGDLDELKMKMQSRKNTILIMEDYLNNNGVQLPPKKAKKADYIELVIAYIRALRMNNEISQSERAEVADDEEETGAADASPPAAASPPQGGNGRRRHQRRNPVTHVIYLKDTLHGRGRGLSP